MFLLAIPVLVAGFISCSNSEDYTKISGEWKCASWINKVKGVDKCSDNVHFKFQADKTYTSTLGSVTDSGSYKIDGDMLYVTPEGKMELAVKITKLNQDTLEFLMNQSGEDEVLTLVKKN